MPKYGRFKYGKLEKYGRYSLQTRDPKVIGPYVQYRMKLLIGQETTEYLTMFHDRLDISIPEGTKIRMRCNDGEWVTTQEESISKEAYNVRIRSIDASGHQTPWVYGNQGVLRKL